MGVRVMVFVGVEVLVSENERMNQVISTTLPALFFTKNRPLFHN